MHNRAKSHEIPTLIEIRRADSDRRYLAFNRPLALGPSTLFLLHHVHTMADISEPTTRTPSPSFSVSSSAADSLSPSSSVSSDGPDKLSSNLPSPFYPPTLARIEGVVQKYQTPALPSEYPQLPQIGTALKGDAKDIGTPDEWVVRDERLVRLTGKWPFNCEAPLPDLWNAVSDARSQASAPARYQPVYPSHRALSHRRRSSTFAITVSCLE